ncbi:hypothetical protein K439DRAFT_1396071 [Ramaria rubella]|nr:hypothetical protein K439DRAFT_1396071 [Ramaria rubella]
MPWPTLAQQVFEMIKEGTWNSFSSHPQPDGAQYMEPYNMLLPSLFPEFIMNHRFFPYVDTQELSEETVPPDVIPSFLIMAPEFAPVFLLMIADPRGLGTSAIRALADEQIRARMREVAPECPIPVLHAVSAMGTRLAFYRMENTSGGGDSATNGDVIVPHPPEGNAAVPAEHWVCDILEKEGEDLLRAVVQEIKDCCETLRLAAQMETNAAWLESVCVKMSLSPA